VQSRRSHELVSIGPGACETRRFRERVRRVSIGEVVEAAERESDWPLLDRVWRGRGAYSICPCALLNGCNADGTGLLNARQGLRGLSNCPSSEHQRQGPETHVANGVGRKAKAAGAPAGRGCDGKEVLVLHSVTDGADPGAWVRIAASARRQSADMTAYPRCRQSTSRCGGRGDADRSAFSAAGLAVARASEGQRQREGQVRTARSRQSCVCRVPDGRVARDASRATTIML